MNAKPYIKSLLASLLMVSWLAVTPCSSGSQEVTSAWNGPQIQEDERPFHLGLKATAPWFPAARALSIRAAAGAAVLRVDAEGAAQVAGLQVGDLIVRFGDCDIGNVEDLVAAAGMAPRGSQQSVIFVRKDRRWQAKFSLLDNPDASALGWYVHPEGAYRVRIPPAWRVLPPPKATNFTLLYDALESAERLYRVEFHRRSRPVEVADVALAEFIRQESTGHSEAVSAVMELGSVPSAWVAWHGGADTPSTFYRIAIVHGGKLYKIEITGPPLAGVDAWSLPVKHLLSTLQTSSQPGSVSTPPAPADGRSVRVGDLSLRLPTAWQDGPALRAGEAIWRVGEFADPEASLALLRNQPFEPFLARLQTSTRSETTLLGRKASVDEGVSAGTGRSARLRIVVVPAVMATDEELIWVCYARTEVWDKYAEEFNRILRSVEPVEEAVPSPSNESQTREPSP